MKVTKPFCIDAEFLPNLKKINASDLINSLLIEYFSGNDEKDLSKLMQKLDKNKAILKKTRKEIKDIELKINKIKQKERLAIAATRKYSLDVVNYVGSFAGESGLFMAHRAHNSDSCRTSEENLHLKGFTWQEIKKLYNEMKGGKV
jgi:vacuolar-type H+-ATPase subunit I/STV1